MNVQKIFEALDEDDQNSALGIICAELESQGYTITIAGTPVTADGFFENNHKEFEGQIEPVNIVLLKDGTPEQEFATEFTDFHDIIIKRAIH